MKLILIALVSLSSGCLQMAQADINESANNHIRALDRECKENMTDWCKMQYERVESIRQNELNDAFLVAQARARIFQEMGRNHTVRVEANCTTDRYGQTLYTQCK